MNSGIYLFTNLVNNKKYVGQAKKNYIERINKHINKLKNNQHYNSHFQAAYNKYSESNFKIELIEEISLDTSIEFFYERENYWMDFYKSYDPKFGYNKLKPGENLISQVPTEETLKKKSEAMKGENNPMFGKHHSKETLKKISENSARLSGEDHPMFGKHPSEESINKRTKTRKERGCGIGEKNPMFGRKGDLSPIKGIKRSDETKQKLSEVNKGKHVGEKNHSAKLNWKQVREIRRLSLEKIKTRKELAEIYNVSLSIIDKIINNQVWKE